MYIFLYFFNSYYFKPERELKGANGQSAILAPNELCPQSKKQKDEAGPDVC